MSKFFINKKLIVSFFILLIVGLSFIFSLKNALAADATQAPEEKEGIYYQPNLFIPGMDKIFTEKKTVKDPITKVEHVEYKINGASLAKYIKAIYNYAGILAGAFAMFMLVYGAWQWLMAGGNASKVTMAKETVTTTLIGLAFLFGGYLLLSQISTRLVNLTTLNVKDVVIAGECVSHTNKPDCDAASCVWQPITAQSADQPAGGTCIEQKCPGEDTLMPIVASSKLIIDPCCSSPKLIPAAAAALQGLALQGDEQIVIKSAYRTYALQAKLYQCYKNCTSDCHQGCSAGCNEAAAPSCEPGKMSKHMDAKAVDVCLISSSYNTCYIDIPTYGRVSYINARYNCLNDAGGGQYSSCTQALHDGQNRLQDLMISAGFSPIPSEWWHFDYTGRQ